MKNIKKIIIIRYGLLGDSLYSFPVLPAIRKNFPHAKIVMVVDPGLMSLLQECPYIDELISFERNGKEKKLSAFFHWIIKQRRQHYDLAFVLNASFQGALLAFLIGAKERWGFDNEKRAFLLTKSFVPESLMPQMLKYRELLKIAGIDPGDYPPTVWIGENARLEYQKLIADLKLDLSRPIVTIHPGARAGADYRVWPVQHIVKTINILSEMGCNLFLIGGPSDASRAEEIVSQVKYPVFNLVGKISLAVLAELFSHASLSIDNDTGPLHLAAIVGAPTIGLFCIDYPGCWIPWGPDVTFIHKPKIVDIQPEDVIAVAQEKLFKNKAQ